MPIRRWYFIFVYVPGIPLLVVAGVGAFLLDDVPDVDMLEARRKSLYEHLAERRLARPGSTGDDDVGSWSEGGRHEGR